MENTNTLVDILGLTECSILRQGDVPQKQKISKKIITENGGINIAKLPSPPFSPKGTGRIFKNRPNSKGNRLPVVDDNMYPIKYVEYDVNYDPKIIGTANRGAERVVIDNNGKAYYTNDHYETFIEF